MRKSIGCEYFYSYFLRFSAFFSIFLRLIALSYIFGSFKLFAPSNSFILPQIPVEEKHPSHDRCLSKGECSHYSTGYTFSRKAAASGIEPEPRAPPCPPAIGEMLPKKRPRARRTPEYVHNAWSSRPPGCYTLATVWGGEPLALRPLAS